MNLTDPETWWRWMQAPFFTVSGTPFTAARLVGLVVIIFGAWWVASKVEKIIRRIARGRPTSTGSVYAWARVVRYGIWVLATFVGLNFIGVDLASFALIGGAVGVGIGFGLQNIFSNFFSGVILLLEKTLKEGDFVDLQSGTRGRVAEIGLRYTRIVTNDEVDIIVPNSEFVSGRVVNWTFGSQFRRLHIPFGVAYGSDKDAVKAAGLRAAESLPTSVTSGRHKSDVWLVGMGDSSLDFELIVWVGAEAVSSPARVEASYKWAIHTELVNAGLEIPFPQRDINFRTGEVQVRLARRERSNGGGDAAQE